MKKAKVWKMPKWMEPYTPLIRSTGGNGVVELMNDDGTNSNVHNNAPRALICVAVKSQVALLEALHEGGHMLPLALPRVQANRSFAHAARLLREEAEVIRQSNVDAKGRWVNAEQEHARHDAMLEHAGVLERLVGK